MPPNRGNESAAIIGGKRIFNALDAHDKPATCSTERVLCGPRKKGEPQQTVFLASMPQVKNGDILDVEEATALLKVSKKTIYTRAKHNAIPYAKLGGKLLFH